MSQFMRLAFVGIVFGVAVGNRHSGHKGIHQTQRALSVEPLNKETKKATTDGAKDESFQAKVWGLFDVSSQFVSLRGGHPILAEPAMHPHQLPVQYRPDGYADTDPSHPRRTPPSQDPVGDHLGWGPDAEQRDSSRNGPMPENFSLLDKLFGPVPTSRGWNLQCTVNVVGSLALMMWTFKNLKVMSDVYFVPSTINLAKEIGMPSDVAGATLLAFGSSAPEFCTNVVASFFITNECGIGDIVGSAIHNILLIVGISGIFAGRLLVLWWYPLSRDSIFFFISILELTVFLMDEYLQIWEASVMVGTYLVYCGWMFWNMPIYNRLARLMKLKGHDVPEDEGEDDDDSEGVLYYDPAEIAWRHTMPSVSKSSLACFLVALTQIAWVSYVMVDAATRFGSTVGIPPLFMGLVFLAAGTSIPDAFASMAAARRGEGDMAVSNALGSNIFDILCGLGLPWLISLLMGKPIVFLGVGRLLYWVFLLMWVLVAFMAVVMIGGWRLSRRVGIALCAMYVAYVFWALLKSVKVVP